MPAPEHKFDTVYDKVDAGALAIVRALRKRGHEAYLVGGCVRDALLGQTPKDWDIVTSAYPEEIEQFFEKTVGVGKAFGVMLVQSKGVDYEVATFRGESRYEDGRHPEEVFFADARQDAERRDFTVNALMYDPEEDRVLDFVDGLSDLKNGVIRTVGDPVSRFLEDHLRPLRAVRFAGRLGFRLENDTEEAIKGMAGLVITVSNERIGEELTRMFTEGSAYQCLCKLDSTGMLMHVLPEVARMQGVPQPYEFHPEGDVMEHTKLMCAHLDETTTASMHNEATANMLPTDDPDILYEADEHANVRFYFCSPLAREILAWTVILHDVGKPPTIQYRERIRFDLHDKRTSELAEEILQRLKRPKRVIHPVCEVAGWHMRFANIPDMREAKRRRVLQDPLFPYHLELHRLDSAGSHGRMDTFSFAARAWVEEHNREPEPEPLLKGGDLLDLGYKPGPLIGRILTAVEDARLENRITTCEEALEWVKENFPVQQQEEER